MYWLDIVAIGIVLVFGIMGFSGLLNRFRGLVFGILLGIFIIGVTPFVLSKFDTGFHINPEKSIIMRYLDKYIPDSIKPQEPR
ncbi:MAG: hypothetical protein SCARUB_00777 [Candidatus Scalindua rubra]|uniref:Uncharacterized protein n=1 Tax=Candidatus Scalindua rubra TaxID=1872076 RepID=A0A1E3XGR0_9BACT|nr:MAG: hypothetical protein SCARUB_00777 [Candidatus Scalindua rubra]